MGRPNSYRGRFLWTPAGERRYAQEAINSEYRFRLNLFFHGVTEALEITPARSSANDAAHPIDWITPSDTFDRIYGFKARPTTSIRPHRRPRRRQSSQSSHRSRSASRRRHGHETTVFSSHDERSRLSDPKSASPTSPVPTTPVCSSSSVSSSPNSFAVKSKARLARLTPLVPPPALPPALPTPARPPSPRPAYPAVPPGFFSSVSQRCEAGVQMAACDVLQTEA